MNILFFFLASFCRYVIIDPKDTFVFQDRVRKDIIYKFIYRAFDAKSIWINIIDPLNREITHSKDNFGVFYTNPKQDGLITIKVYNPSSSSVKFGYRCPDIDKELQGPLGPIKDVDTVAELQQVLENIISTQREHIRRHERHEEMVKKSRKWVFRLVLLEIVTSIVIMFYLHKDTLKMFDKKAVPQ